MLNTSMGRIGQYSTARVGVLSPSAGQSPPPGSSAPRAFPGPCNPPEDPADAQWMADGRPVCAWSFFTRMQQQVNAMSGGNREVRSGAAAS